MGRIYSTAQITLIASAGETSAYGLPGVRPGSREHTFHYEAVGWQLSDSNAQSLYEGCFQIQVGDQSMVGKVYTTPLAAGELTVNQDSSGRILVEETPLLYRPSAIVYMQRGYMYRVR
jgi:hypothetical protein